MKIILKIGGSILFDGDQINTSLIKEIADMINRLRNADHAIGVVVGGGTPARKYSNAAKELGATHSFQDILGIEAAKQNARLLIAALDQAYPQPPTNYYELTQVSATHDLVIVGGFQPGQSTNAVAALFAEQIKADYLFNLSNVDKVYNKDPSVYEDAKPFDNISYDQFTKSIINNEQLPGKYALFDHLGLEIVKRSKIKLVFINGTKPDFVIDVLEGRERGTIIS